MKVLVVKTSSMGDVIHALPALVDATRALPTIQFDWVVEEDFSEIPAWHPQVARVIPVALRRWRKQPWSSLCGAEWKSFRQAMKQDHYDFIIDAQGLTKSALLARLAYGVRCGFDRASARDPWASLHYQQRYTVTKNAHAVTRLRQLFSQILNYPMPEGLPDYGIDRKTLPASPLTAHSQRYLVFLHSTTWPTKLWPEPYWRSLIEQSVRAGYDVILPSGNAAEYQRAERLAAHLPQVKALPRQSIASIASILAKAHAVVAVDTGFLHLAAALAVPTISLYGPTNAALTGALGFSQVHLTADFSCAPCLARDCHYPGDKTVNPPCFAQITPEQVWQALQ